MTFLKIKRETLLFVALVLIKTAGKLSARKSYDVGVASFAICEVLIVCCSNCQSWSKVSLICFSCFINYFTMPKSVVSDKSRAKTYETEWENET